MSDPLDPLFSEEPEDLIEQPEAATDEPVADDTPAPEPAPVVEPVAAQPSQGKGDTAAPPAAQEDRNQSIPITALLDEREKRKRYEQEAQDLRRKLQEFEARSKPQPDFYDDPQGALQRQQEQFQTLLAKDRVQRSHFMAVQEHGPEFVQEVIDFYNDPRHMPKSHEFLAHPFPMQEAIKYFRQQKALAEIGDDPAAYRERLRQELMAEMQASAPQPVQPTKPPTPPRSMAASPSAQPVRSNPLPVDPLFD